MLVFRNFKLKEDEQYRREIKPVLEQQQEAVPVYDTEHHLCGWKIQAHLNT